MPAKIGSSNLYDSLGGGKGHLKILFVCEAIVGGKLYPSKLNFRSGN